MPVTIKKGDDRGRTNRRYEVTNSHSNNFAIQIGQSKVFPAPSWQDGVEHPPSMTFFTENGNGMNERITDALSTACDEHEIARDNRTIYALEKVGKEAFSYSPKHQANPKMRTKFDVFVDKSLEILSTNDDILSTEDAKQIIAHEQQYRLPTDRDIMGL